MSRPVGELTRQEISTSSLFLSCNPKNADYATAMSHGCNRCNFSEFSTALSTFSMRSRKKEAYLCCESCSYPRKQVCAVSSFICRTLSRPLDLRINIHIPYRRVWLTSIENLETFVAANNSVCLLQVSPLLEYRVHQHQHLTVSVHKSTVHKFTSTSTGARAGACSRLTPPVVSSTPFYHFT
jgi:hypothetical protein